MNTNTTKKQKQFHLLSVDFFQTLAVFFFVIGHTMLWWDGNINVKWPDITLIGAIFLTIGLVTLPCFLFLYGFNVSNSLRRKEDRIARKKARTQLMKRSIIFFLIAELCEGIAALITSPERIINALFTWQLFHMFATTTVILLLIYECTWHIEANSFLKQKQITNSILLLALLIIILVFLLFHDYTLSQEIQGIYVDLNITSILQKVFFEDGQSPLIPWLSFSLTGGLLASFLDLPYEKKDVVQKKAIIVILVGFLILMVGYIYLNVEIFVAPPVLLPASSSFVLVTIGALILCMMSLVLAVDYTILFSNKRTRKILISLTVVSKITLTVFIFHNVAYIIPAESPIVNTLITTETMVIIAGIIYSLFFVLIAYIWQKWKFKYSIEWIISKLQTMQWK